MSIKLSYEDKFSLFEPGTYAGELCAVEAKDGGKFGPCFEYTFIASNGETDTTVTMLSSQKFNPKSKAFQIVAALLQRCPEPREVVDIDDLCNRTCRLVLGITELDDGRKFNKIIEVLPAKHPADQEAETTP